MIPNRISSGAIAATVAAVGAMAAGLLFADREDSPRTDSPRADSTEQCSVDARRDSQFLGADSCALCHQTSRPVRLPHSLATLDEFDVWNSYDRHRIAFDALKSSRAKQMERILHTSAAADRRCLACHSIVLTDESTDRAVLTDSASREGASALGVSCEACHGRSSLWIDLHWKRGAWAELKPPEAEHKYERYGMTNLHQAAMRVELCTSCHVGSIACGKFVTHEMFAAGHPPLPAFEIETFLEQMPPHWRPLAPFSRSQSVVLEGLIELRASIELLLDAASAKSASGGAVATAGDFAIYNCSACHHELEFPSPRQARGYFTVRPGRPALRSWNVPLTVAGFMMQASTEEASGLRDLEREIGPLQAAMSVKPFGDSQAVRAAAKNVIERLDQAIAELQIKPWHARETRRLFEAICAAAVQAPLDYDAAWQVVGALRAVRADLEQAAPDEQSFRFDPRLNSLIEELAADVSFPAARDRSRSAPSYGTTLWRNGLEFDSERFRSKLTEIASILAAH
jgi:hypothetical protein